MQSGLFWKLPESSGNIPKPPKIEINKSEEPIE